MSGKLIDLQISYSDQNSEQVNNSRENSSTCRYMYRYIIIRHTFLALLTLCTIQFSSFVTFRTSSTGFTTIITGNQNIKITIMITRVSNNSILSSFSANFLTIIFILYTINVAMMINLNRVFLTYSKILLHREYIGFCCFCFGKNLWDTVCTLLTHLLLNNFLQKKQTVFTCQSKVISYLY